jgi:hypothetical protein
VLGTHGRSFYVLDDINPLRELSPQVAASPLHVFQPRPFHRMLTGGHWRITLEENAVFHYYLQHPVDRVVVEILDADGRLIRHLEGSAVDSDDGSPTTAAGMNRVEWDLTYPGATVFDGIITWRATPEVGPLAPPGRYQLRVSAAGRTETRTFVIRMDPRLEGVTVADLREQFQLAQRITDRTSDAHEAVIRIRELRADVNDRLERTTTPAVQSAAQEVLWKTAAVEEALYQVRNRSPQDPLNFPIKLANRLATLRTSVENGQARPTDGHYQVFEELSAELDDQLATLDAVLETELTRLNELLRGEGLEPIEVPGRVAQ